jgi:hypothetical protein
MPTDSTRPAPPRWLAPACITAGVAVLGAAAAYELRGAWDLRLSGSLVMLLGALLVLDGTLQRATGSATGIAAAIARGGRLGRFATFAPAALAMATLLYNFRGYIVDDSFITYRYARNLAHGLGPAWNPGDPPVEGYSNFLWMLMTALAMRLGIDPVVASRVLGAVATAASAVALHGLARALGASPSRAALPVLLFAAIPAFALWSMSGLETASVVLFAILFFRALALDLPRAGWPWRTALWGAMLVLSRPDGLALIGLALLPLLWKPPAARLRTLVRLAMLLAVPVAAYQLWRWATFGTLTANTVSAKVHALAGLDLVTDFLAYTLPLLVLAALRAGARDAAPVERSLAAAAAGFMVLGLNVMPHVGHAHRFFLPLLAPLLALAALPALDGSALLRAPGQAARAVAVALLFAYLLAPVFRLKAYADIEAEGLRRAHIPVGETLKRTFTPTDVLAASDVGVIPYLCDMRTVDVYGLTDRRIATEGFSTDYVLAQRPAALILNSLDGSSFHGREPYDHALHARIADDPQYQLAARVPYISYSLWVYSRSPLR